MYNISMSIDARKQIKSLLATRGMTIKELAVILSKRTGKSYTSASISGKFQRGSLSYNEMLSICEILDYQIEFKSLR